MKKIKENFSNLFICIGEIIVGILLLISPIEFTKGIIVGIGILLTIFGIVNIIRYFSTNVLEGMREQTLSSGFIFTVLGLFCILNANWFVITFPVLTILYGILILILGLKKLAWSIHLIRLKQKHWFIVGINSVLSILFSIIIMKNPFSTMTLLWQFTGAILIVESIFDIVAIFFETKK